MKDEGWRILDDSWLDMEEETGTPTYVNVVNEDDDNDEGLEEGQGDEGGNTSLENICGSSPKDCEEREGSTDDIQTRKKKDDFQGGESKAYLFPAKRRRQCKRETKGEKRPIKRRPR